MQQSAPSEKQKSYLQMRRLAFFRCISSRVYTAAVQVMDRREDNYIAYYSFCDLGEYKKNLSFTYTDKSLPLHQLTRGNLEGRLGRGEMNLGRALAEVFSPSKHRDERRGVGAALKAWLLWRKRQEPSLPLKLSGKHGCSSGCLLPLRLPCILVKLQKLLSCSGRFPVSDGC